MKTLVVFLLLFSVNSLVSAEFYTWVDADGERRVSNIPPAGLNADGSVKAGHHPDAIAMQRARVERQLRQRDAELELEAEAKKDASELPSFSLDLFGNNEK